MMESRKESLSALKLCRFCLSQDETLTSLYKKNRVPRKSITLPLKILSCVSIEVFPSDKMPAYICDRCNFFMDLFYEYKKICRQADENILQFLRSENILEAVPWPVSLNKVYRGSNRSKVSSEVAIVKTVVEGGATVQVSTQDSGTDMDDDDNVYNVKIDDGSDDESKNACVKVITSSEKQGELKGRRARKDSEEVEIIMEKQSMEDGCWPCDECDCTYPLQQLLELHKVQKHRERTAQCDQCDAKFFTKYDLAVHQLRHTNEMLFQCVACDKKFKRLILLKRHEKLMHADLPQQVCPNCPASFLSLEELEAHQQKHRSHLQRRYVCPICDKKFPEMSSLRRHKDLVHEQKPAYCCEYCPQRFSSVSKLTRHVRSHAGDRAYPCKYCDKSFMKSHHYTRHLRLKHRETIRSSRGPFGEPDQYRCEQCEDSFATQDELIYHSAIHATQNLTCPLCQEKFPDVDAVTAHIKSHVSGMEFMCDFCELIFTSNDKLNNHMAMAHEDELNNEELELDDSSIEMAAQDDEDDAGINVKEEDGQMVLEIKKADEFMITSYKADSVEKMDVTNSEESESEVTYTELATVDPGVIAKNEYNKSHENSPSKVLGGAIITKTQIVAPKPANVSENQVTASILRKAEEIKRKVILQKTPEAAPKKDKANNKVESSNPPGASDKSLRLLEKELQELKRTNTRNEVVKATPAKSIETLRNRRPQIHTSTPKPRPVEERKPQQVPVKPQVVEKKVIERRVITKENKEPKESKEVKEIKNNNSSIKENNSDKESKEKEAPKASVKNGNDKSITDDGVRRSTRPSKIKDYAKMIRDSSQVSGSSNEESDEEDYEESEKSPEVQPRQKRRRSSAKPPPAPKPAPAPAPGAPVRRKRGRPRKDGRPSQPVPSKIVRKEDSGEDEKTKEKMESEGNSKTEEGSEKETDKSNSTDTAEGNAASGEQKTPTSGVLVSPTGQTLKKVPIKALPPGVKPLPLPISARAMGGGEVCEMQIGKKLVKVQKIVMTKAEVEAMAKKGLVEMKDGTMVLKQGIKIPTSDAAALKSTLLVGDEAAKESPVRKEKAAPTRCDLGNDV